MKQIIIRNKNNIVTQVDDADYISLSMCSWAMDAKGYVYRTHKRNGIEKRIYMARVIMNSPEGLMVDHKDRNPLNNQKENLRICTRGQNRANSIRKILCKNKFKGAYHNPTANKMFPYISNICVDGRRIYLGYFKTDVEAARAYNEAAKKYHGEFAVLNIFERNEEKENADRK